MSDAGQGSTVAAQWSRLSKSLSRMSDAERTRVELLLKQEYDQSWNHYRQLETTRTQYLGFLFAALFTLAPVAKSVADARVLSDFRLPIAAVVGAVYAAMAVFVLSVVRRNNEVLRYYDYAMQQIPRVFYGSHYDEVTRLLSLEMTPGLTSRRFRISAAAESLCLGVAVGIPVVMVLLSAVPISIEGVGWPKYLALVISTSTAARVALTLRRSRADRADVPRRGFAARAMWWRRGRD